mgnify:CR=1 FL=1|jgi:hypothetical protein
MKYSEFKDALQKAGWKAVLDAQHTGIREVWEKAFPLHAEIEELETALYKVEAECYHLQDMLGDLT